MTSLENAKGGPSPSVAPAPDGTSLKFAHALGFRQVANKSVAHADDESLVYLIGKHVTVFNHETRTHRFILKNPKAAAIVAFCLSPNRRYIALSERLTEDDVVQVSVYNVATATRVRTLPLTHPSKSPVVALDFSRDNKFLAAATQPPGLSVCLWQLDKAKLLATTDVPFACSRISISPWAHWKLCTTGTDTLRIWHFADKQLKAMDPLKRKDYRFTCHAWFDDDKLLVGTREGDVLVVAGEDDRPMELRRTFQTVHEMAPVWAIVALGRGFICAGDGGLLTLFERTYDAEYFRKYKRFRLPGKQRIVDLSLSPTEETVVCCAQTNEVFLFSLATVDIAKAEDPASFRPLPIGFHADTVTAIDVCIQRPIVVTAGLDRRVRLWNYAKRQAEVTKIFEEEALSVACHPTGLFILVGLKSHMGMFSVLSRDLHQIADFPVKACREVRFCHGGQYFAAAVASRVFLFASYSFECLGSLQGHSGAVKSICWLKGDAALATAGNEGAIYVWRVDGLRREETEDHIARATVFTGLCVDTATGVCAAIGTSKLDPSSDGERVLRQVAKGQELREVRLGPVDPRRTPKIHEVELALCLTAATLFVGTPGGQVLLYPWPLPADAQPFHRYDLHHGATLLLRLSADDRHLFTVGEDCALFVLDVDALVDGRLVTRPPFSYALLDEVAHVLQPDLEDRARTIEHLRTQLEEVGRTQQLAMERLKETHRAERQAAETEAQRSVAGLKARVAALEAERDQALGQKAQQERDLEAVHLTAAEELEALFQRRSEEQTKKYERLREERDDLVARYEERILRLRREKEEEVARATGQRSAEVEAMARALEELTLQKERAARHQEDAFQEMCLEYEKELEAIRASAQESGSREAQELSGAKGQMAVLRTKFDGLNSKIKELTADKDDHTKALARKDKRIEDLERSLSALRLELNVRNDTLSTSEKKVLELKKQNAELEKLRYVLTFKFNDMRQDMAPKQEQIQRLTERLQSMGEELEHLGFERDALRQQLGGREDKLLAHQRAIRKMEQKKGSQERSLQALLVELTNLLADKDPRSLAQQLRDLIVRYDSQSHQEAASHGRNTMMEFERQRTYLEAQLATTQTHQRRKEEHLRQDNARKTEENVALVREVNELRHEGRTLATKVSFLEAQLREARMATQHVPTPQSPGRSAGPKDSPTRGRSLSPTSKAGGRLLRGPTRTLRDWTHMDPGKVAEIIATVERNNAEMARQQEEIRRLRDFVQRLLQRVDPDAATTWCRRGLVSTPAQLQS
jgi:WD40 repeat protein